MSEGDEVGGCCSADAGVGFMGSRDSRRGRAPRNGEMSQSSGRGAIMALENSDVIEANGGVGGHEGNIAANIAQLSNVQEGVGCKVWDNMHFAGRQWETRYVELGFVHGMHDGAVWVANTNGISCNAVVNDWGSSAEEVTGATNFG
jgi:hypothetical protein